MKRGPTLIQEPLFEPWVPKGPILSSASTVNDTLPTNCPYSFVSERSSQWKSRNNKGLSTFLNVWSKYGREIGKFFWGSWTFTWLGKIIYYLSSEIFWSHLGGDLRASWSERGEWKSWLKTQHSEDDGIWSHHFMANRWGKSGNCEEFIFLGSKITADGDCSHWIKRVFLLGRKAATNLDNILKSRDIT